MKFWTWLRSNPYFVAATSALFGAILNGLYQEVQAGGINWTVKGWESLGATAAGAAVIALYHLYIQAPAPAKPAEATQKLGALALISVLLVGMMPVMATTGCSGTQIINEINVVLNEADAVLAVAEPGASWVIPLKNAIVALQGAETAWQNGGVVAIVDDALNTLTVVLAVIPLTAIYSPLIDVLVAGIEAVLAALPVSGSLGAQKVMVTVAENPHAGRYKMVFHWYRTPAGNLKANWNAVAKAHGLQKMVIA